MKAKTQKVEKTETKNENAIDLIRAIQEEATKKIDALKADAVSELVAKIEVKKAELLVLTNDYEALTGIDITGKAKVGQKRQRMSDDERKTLFNIVLGVIEESKAEGVSMKTLLEKTGSKAFIIRPMLKDIPKIKVTGERSSTVYSIGK